MGGKIKAQVEQLGVTPIFYYLKTNEGTPWGTVCLLVKENKEVLARGISVCSPRDVFLKKEGRGKALGRAMQAAINKESRDLIKPKNLVEKIGRFRASYLLDRSIDYKSSYMPSILTIEESELIK